MIKKGQLIINSYRHHRLKVIKNEVLSYVATVHATAQCNEDFSLQAKQRYIPEDMFFSTIHTFYVHRLRRRSRGLAVLNGRG